MNSPQKNQAEARGESRTKIELSSNEGSMIVGDGYIIARPIIKPVRYVASRAESWSLRGNSTALYDAPLPKSSVERPVRKVGSVIIPIRARAGRRSSVIENDTHSHK